METERWHILLIEDDAAQLAEYSRVLESKGYEITAVENAEDAIRSSERRRFDAILTDNILPGMTGLQALSRLRKSRAPVIVMSSEGGADMEKDALLLGAVAFIKKPLASDELCRIVRHACNSGRDQPG